MQNNPAEELLANHFKAVQKAYADQFEIIRTPLGYQCRHKVTHQGPQAHSVSAAPWWKVTQ